MPEPGAWNQAWEEWAPSGQRAAALACMVAFLVGVVALSVAERGAVRLAVAVPIGAAVVSGRAGLSVIAYPVG